MIIDERRGARRVALVSLAVAVTMASLKLAAGIATGSLALLSEALHSTLDAGATALTAFAVRLADKPPDREHPYGHGRAENLAALAESAVLVVLGVLVGVAAVKRLVAGEPFRAPVYAIVLVAGSIVVDVWRSRALRRAARRYSSQALQADALNFSTDVLSSIAVLAGLAAARLGFPAGDAIAAIVVVVVVGTLGVRLAISAINVLMDAMPEGLDDRLRTAALGVDGVVDVTDVRVRSSGPHALAEVLVTVGRTHSVQRSSEIADAVQRRLAEIVPGTRSVVHVLPTGEGEDLVGRVFAAANRLGLADQVHNVLSIRHPEGMWLMLHAKVDADVSLARGHQITDALETELRSEIEGLARVEIHLEPRESPSLAGRVVTTGVPDLVSAVTAIAERHPPIERCHEVAVSDVDGGLHLVLHCEAAEDSTIGTIHAASSAVENDIHSSFANVATVTVHFEPSEAGPHGA